jgi:predicted GH43/DUF377 family glycosyl hydrolase
VALAWRALRSTAAAIDRCQRGLIFVLFTLDTCTGTSPSHAKLQEFLLKAGVSGEKGLLHRPVSAFTTVGAHIWISFRPDMKHWGDHQILVPGRSGAWWDANKIGLSPPPLRTNKSWLLLFHGVRTTASGCLYRLGLALLDLDDPTKLLARSGEWVFAPKERYEVVGDVDKVVFLCGWVTEGDQGCLYYGGADKCLALATARMSEMLDWLEEHNHLGLE